MVLANGRLSEQSARKLSRFRWLAEPAISSLMGIGAQTQDDANRLIEAGGLPRRNGPIVEVTGNMKFDIQVPQSQTYLGEQWRDQLGSGPIFLAASTRDDEELELLNAWKAAQHRGLLERARLLIVPRHPQRFDRVAKIIRQQGFVPRSRSAQWRRDSDHDYGAHGQPSEVLLGDSLGEMFAYLQLSDVVLIGGSIPALGGQNPIEACALGKPVFFGRHMFNFSQISSDLTTCGAGVVVENYEQWLDRALVLLTDTARLGSVAHAALAYAQAHRGATHRTLHLMKTILSAAR